MWGWRLTLGRGKVNHVAVGLEHVDLFNRLDGLHIHLLERRLQLLVVRAAALVHLLDLSPRCSLATVRGCRSACASVSGFQFAVQDASFGCVFHSERGGEAELFYGGVPIAGAAGRWSAAKQLRNVFLTLQACQHGHINTPNKFQPLAELHASTYLCAQHFACVEAWPDPSWAVARTELVPLDIPGDVSRERLEAVAAGCFGAADEWLRSQRLYSTESCMPVWTVRACEHGTCRVTLLWATTR